MKLSGAATLTAATVGHSVGEAPKSLTNQPPETGTFYVSPQGNDEHAGTASAPFATLQRAQRAVRETKNSSAPVKVLVLKGTHYLDSPLTFRPEDSRIAGAPALFAAAAGQQVTISGGRKLACSWTPYKNGIMMTPVPAGLDFTQLFVNGKRQIRARYPNFDPSSPSTSGYIQAAGPIPAGIANPYAGGDEDMTFSAQAPRGIRFDPSTFSKKKWSNLQGAEIHIYQAAYWGNLQWKIKGIDFPTNSIWFGDGGQQIGAKWSKNPAVLNQKSRFFIENVFEELDAPGEWFLDKSTNVLYHYPENGIDLRSATIEVPLLADVIRFVGTQDDPVQNISLQGFRIAHTAATYLKFLRCALLKRLGDSPRWGVVRGRHPQLLH